MKKNLFSKILVASSLAGLVGCGGTTSSSATTPTTPVAQTTVKSGVATYTSHGNQYGMAVKVTFDSTQKITKVERDAAKIEELGLVEVTLMDSGNWHGEEMREVYDEKIDEALAKFVGLNATTYYNEAVAAVGNVNIADRTGWPASDSTFATKYFVITGATQSSTRLSIAVANACAALLSEEEITFKTESATPSTPSTPSSSTTEESAE